MRTDGHAKLIVFSLNSAQALKKQTNTRKFNNFIASLKKLHLCKVPCLFFVLCSYHNGKFVGALLPLLLCHSIDESYSYRNY